MSIQFHCEMFMNCNKNFMDICKKQICLPNVEHPKGIIYKGKKWLTNIKIFEAVNSTLHGKCNSVWKYKYVQIQNY